MFKEIRDDHIGIFDDYFGAQMCDDYINYYKELETKGFIKTRQEERPELDPLLVKDQATDLLVPPAQKFGSFNITYHASEFNAMFWGGPYAEYRKKYSYLDTYPRHNIYSIRLQKTSPGEGYHTWHSEDNGHQLKGRIMAYMLYLNDDFEGGETEFIYQKDRITPRKNRLLIWPATYTHVHRGNPPIRGDKYIITGWVEMG